MPRYVAVILDGNRRFAREERLPSLYASYSRGAQRVWEVLACSGGRFRRPARVGPPATIIAQTFAALTLPAVACRSAPTR